MLNSSSPIPSNSRAASGSPAISPHIPTRFPSFLPASIVVCRADSTAGCSGSYRSARTPVTAIDCQYVLNQVVRSDAQKVHLPEKPIRQLNGGRDFHHNSELHLPVEGRTFVTKFVLRFPQ